MRIKLLFWKKVEEGEHKQLLAKKNDYFKLWKNQTIGIEQCVTATSLPNDV